MSVTKMYDIFPWKFKFSYNRYLHILVYPQVIMSPIILYNEYMLTKINKIMGQLFEKGIIFPITTDVTISCEVMQ